MQPAKALILGLLLFVPLSVVADLWDWGDTAVFLTSTLAIVPLSISLSTATEKVALVTGPTVGGLVNAVFGNATELIIAIVALRAGLVDIVQASITGTILSDLLVLMGLAMLAGGIRFKEQSFKPILAKVNGSSMTVAVVAIALPTLVIATSNLVDQGAIVAISLATALVLIGVYGLTLLFSLKTHSYLYEVGLAEAVPEGEAAVPEDQLPRLGVWVVILLASTLAVAFESDLFVGVVEKETGRLGLTALFTGVVLIPVVSDIAGYVTMVSLSLKNQMDLAVSTALGDALLVALFMAPVLVLVGQWIGQPIDLNFNPFEAVALAIAVTVTNLVSFSGRSNWLDGTLLLATYLLLGVAFYFHPV